jgi:hypothetical protein
MVCEDSAAEPLIRNGHLLSSSLQVEAAFNLSPRLEEVTLKPTEELI